MRGAKTSQMVRSRLLVALGVFTLAPVSAWAASLTVGSVSGTKGATVAFSAALNSEGAAVNGVQNDLSYDATNTPIDVRTSGNCSVTVTKACSTDAECPDLPSPFTGKEPCVNVTSAPACTVNTSIGKGGFFSFIPTGCSGASCTGIRAVIIALDNTDAITSGQPLYSCRVKIAPDAANQAYPLTASNIVASDTSFEPVCGAGTAPACGGTNGAVNVNEFSCACDCNGDSEVGAGELLTGLDILLGNLDLSSCTAADVNHDGEVGAGELLTGLDNLLQGCP